MTPVWVFPAYPLLLTAPFAGNLINSAGDDIGLIRGLPIAMAAVAVQGMGFCLSFMILAAFIYRLMTQKLPRDMQRPGVFISIGPSGFTTAGIGKTAGLMSYPLVFNLVTLTHDSSTWQTVGQLHPGKLHGPRHDWSCCIYHEADVRLDRPVAMGSRRLVSFCPAHGTS